MQLISAILLLFSIILFVGTLLFVGLWHRSHAQTKLLHSIRDGIGNIGISTIVEFPSTTAPMAALLDEEYPRHEVIVVADLQVENSPFSQIKRRFQLVGVNHNHLKGVRGLYRSRHRAFRRIVLVDIDSASRHLACDAARAIASYDYLLHLENESIIQSGAITYCANLIASHPHTSNISVSTIVGAKAQLERCDKSAKMEQKPLLTGRILAWRNHSLTPLIIAIALPVAISFIAHATASRLLLFAAAITALALVCLTYISCCLVFKKSLFATLSTIIESFYRFMIERAQRVYRRYARYAKEKSPSQPIFAINTKRTKRDKYDREAN